VAKTDYKSVDEYIAAQPEGSRAALEAVRATIRRAVPRAKEVISYQIPAFKVDGKPVIYFAGWKEHYSLYPVTERTQAVFRDALAPYKVSKGTIRFPLSARIPTELIGRIAEFRAKEVAGHSKAKGTRQKATVTKAAARK
jgi:uncharacterized protein YdhG (YjbR/CyaY superfamily)